MFENPVTVLVRSQLRRLGRRVAQFAEATGIQIQTIAPVSNVLGSESRAVDREPKVAGSTPAPRASNHPSINYGGSSASERRYQSEQRLKRRRSEPRFVPTLVSISGDMLETCLPRKTRLHPVPRPGYGRGTLFPLIRDVAYCLGAVAWLGFLLAMAWVAMAVVGGQL